MKKGRKTVWFSPSFFSFLCERQQWQSQLRQRQLGAEEPRLPLWKALVPRAAAVASPSVMRWVRRWGEVLIEEVKYLDEDISIWFLHSPSTEWSNFHIIPLVAVKNPWKNQVVFPADCLSAVIVFCKPLATAAESGRIIYSVWIYRRWPEYREPGLISCFGQRDIGCLHDVVHEFVQG